MATVCCTTTTAKPRLFLRDVVGQPAQAGAAQEAVRAAPAPADRVEIHFVVGALILKTPRLRSTKDSDSSFLCVFQRALAWLQREQRRIGDDDAATFCIYYARFAGPLRSSCASRSRRRTTGWRNRSTTAW